MKVVLPIQNAGGQYRKTTYQDRYFLRFFRKCTIFKVFIEFLQYSFCYKTETIFLVFWPQGVWDLSSLTRDQVCVPCIGR